MKDRDGHEMSRKWGGMKGKLYRGEGVEWMREGRLITRKRDPAWGGQ